MINPRFFIIILLLGISSLGHNLFGQNKSIATNLKSPQKRAEELYNQGSFSEAINFYEEVLKKKPADAPAKLKIAECYKFLNNPEQVVVWMSKAINSAEVQPIHKLYYAEALAGTGNYGEAKSWFQKYSAEVTDDRRARLQVEALDKLSAFYQDSSSYKIKEMKASAPQPDFGPAFYDKGIVFLSGRSEKLPVKYIFTRDNSSFLDLYYSKTDSAGELSLSKKFNSEINTKYHDGPICLFDGGKRMVFTRNEGKSGIESNPLQIFEAERSKNGKSWINIKPLSVNSKEYSVAHPAINDAGTILYFASDMPGGYGGSDIYIVRKVNGQWSAPENLGSDVNTEGNEVFPFLHENELYFSSNGLGVLGGLDIFKVSLDKTPLKSENLGCPINSSKDDFGLILNSKHTGYFSSSRGKDNNDNLYWVKFLNKQPVAGPEEPIASTKPSTTRLEGHIFDISTGKPLADADVFVLNEVTGEEIKLKADDNGNFSFDARLEDSYALMAEKDDYSAFVTEVKANDPKFKKNDAIQLAAIKPSFNREVVIEATLLDSLTNESVKLAKVTLFDGESEKSREISTLEGKVYFKANLVREYRLSIDNPNYKSKDVFASTKAYFPNDTFKLTIPLVKIKRSIATVKGKIVEASSGAPLAKAEIYILNAVTGEDRTLFSDDKGEFNFEGRIGDNYAFSGEKENFSAFLIDVKIEDPEIAPGQEIRLEAVTPKFARDITLQIVATDKETKEPLKLVALKLTEVETKEDQMVYTTSSGKVYFTVLNEKSFTLSTDLRGYKTETIDIKRNQTFIGDTLTIPVVLEKLKTTNLTILANISDAKSDKPLSKASITVLNEVTGELQKVEADDKGNFNFNANTLDSYAIIGEKGNKIASLLGVRFTEENNAPLKLSATDLIEDPADNQKMIIVRVIDKENQMPLTLANVKVFEGKINLKTQPANADGVARFILPEGKDFLVKGENVTYIEKVASISTSGDKDSIMVTLELIKILPATITLYGNIYDLGLGEPLSYASIYVLNETTGEQQTLTADEDGNFEFAANPQYTHAIIGEKGNKSAMIINVQADEAAQDINKKIRLSVEDHKKQITIVATIVDEKTNEPIKLASMTLMEKNVQKDKVYSSVSGVGVLKGSPGKEYVLDIASVNHGTKSISISTKFPPENDTIQTTIKLQEIEPTEVQQPVVILNEKTGQPLANAKVYVLNETTGEEQNLLADAKGAFSFNSKLDQSYSIMAEKDDMSAFMIDIHSQNPKLGIDTIEMMATSTKVEMLMVSVVVKDLNSKEPVKLVNVSVTDRDVKIEELTTTSEGTVYFTSVKNKKYILKTEHPGYLEKSEPFTTKSEKDTLFIELYLEKLKPTYTTLYAQLVDDKTNEPISNAEVKVYNEVTGEEQKYLTDDNGTIQVKAKYSDSYTFKNAEKDKTAILTGVKPEESEDGTKNKHQLIAVKAINKDAQILTAEELKIVEVLSGKEQVFISSNGTLYEYVSSGSIKMLKNKREKKILASQAYTAKGKSLYEDFASTVNPANISSKVVIKNIYYNFNEAVLSEAAKEELKRIADVMTAHEEVVLKMNAFADNRGSNNYNLSLSQKRAKAATSYLMSLGIDKSRIVSGALGEARLVKPCPKPQDCTEEEHQLNRRTEFWLAF